MTSRVRGAWVVVLAVVLSSCGGDDDTADDGDGDGDGGDVATQDDAGDDGDPAADSPEASLQRLIDNSDSYGEATPAVGGRVLVAVDCDPVTGDNLLSVGSVGVPQGVYAGEVEPAAGGDVTLQVLPTGEGLGARQTRLDEP